MIRAIRTHGADLDSDRAHDESRARQLTGSEWLVGQQSRARQSDHDLEHQQDREATRIHVAGAEYGEPDDGAVTCPGLSYQSLC